MAEMNNVIDQAAEVLEQAGMDVTMIPEAAAKKFDIKSFVGGTVIGAAGAVLVRKAVKAINDSKAEIKEETDKVKAEKLRKKMDKIQGQLDELEKAEEPEVLEGEVEE